MPQAPCFLPSWLNCEAEAGSDSSTQAGRGPRCPHDVSPRTCLQTPRTSCRDPSWGVGGSPSQAHDRPFQPHATGPASTSCSWPVCSEIIGELGKENVWLYMRPSGTPSPLLVQK